MQDVQDPKFIEQHAQLRDALKAKGVSTFYANKTAANILTGNVTEKTLSRLVEALEN